MDSENTSFVTVMRSLTDHYFPAVKRVGVSGDYETVYPGGVLKLKRTRAHAEAEGRVMAVRLKMEFRP